MAVKINGTTIIDNSGNLVNGATITGTSFVGVFPSGISKFFSQTSSPTGWTKSTSINDYALRVVSGTAGSNSATAFSSIFASRGIGGSISTDAQSLSQFPSHTHQVDTNSFAGTLQVEVGASSGDGSNYAHSDYFADASAEDTEYGWYSGSNSGHSHSFTGTSINFAIQYVDCINATKD